MTPSAAVQTSAPAAEVDLFGTVPTAAPCIRAVFEGTLREDAHVAVRPADHGHARPVVVLDLVDVGAGHHCLHVEQPFPHADRFVADAHAARLKRGMRVQILAPLKGSTLVLPNAEQVTAISATQSH